MPLSYEQRVLQVLEYIHDNPAGDLSLDALAEIANVSRFHWHRVFHAMTGETCAQSVRRIRLFLAAKWLLNDDGPVAEIAVRAGYPNLQSFTRAFNERFGVPPAAFRKSGLPGSLPTQLLREDRRNRGNLTMFKIETTNQPERQLGAILHKGAYTGIGNVFAKLASMATQQNLWPSVRGFIGVHYDDPNVVDESELRAHAGIWIAEGTRLPASLEAVDLPASQCAVLHYKGPYTSIKVAYDYLYGDWLAKSGREAADSPPYEIYLNNPDDTEESELLTDIVLPLVSLKS